MSTAKNVSNDVSVERALLHEGSINDSVLIPVCCVCGLIRDDRGSVPIQARWITLKAYRLGRNLRSNELFFTHTYCPDCLAKAYDKLKQSFHTLKR